MTAATALLYRDSGTLTSGHGTTQASAEGGTTIGRNEAGSAVLPIPATTGTAFSWDFWYYLDVTVAGSPATNFSNRTVAKSAATTGLKAWYKAVASGAYVQPTAPLAADAGTNGATPAGFTEISTTPAVYDSSSIASNTGQNGKYVQYGWGVDNSFAGGPGSYGAGNILLGYDEGP